MQPTLLTGARPRDLVRIAAEIPARDRPGPIVNGVALTGLEGRWLVSNGLIVIPAAIAVTARISWPTYDVLYSQKERPCPSLSLSAPDGVARQ